MDDGNRNHCADRAFPRAKLESPVKQRLFSIIAAAAAVAVIGIIYVTAPIAQDSAASTRDQIDRELDQAQRMLAAYEPMDQLLEIAQARLTSAGGPLGPGTEAAANLPAHWSRAVSSENPLMRLTSLSPDAQQVWDDALKKYKECAGEAGGEASAAADAVSAYQSLEARFARNNKLLTDAIRIVDGALAISSSGPDGFSGRDHVEANRLRAILAREYAESLRRTAARRRAALDPLIEQLVSLHGEWLAVSGELAGAEMELTGKTSVTVPPIAAPPPKERTTPAPDEPSPPTETTEPSPHEAGDEASSTTPTEPAPTDPAPSDAAPSDVAPSDAAPADTAEPKDAGPAAGPEDDKGSESEAKPADATPVEASTEPPAAHTGVAAWVPTTDHPPIPAQITELEQQVEAAQERIRNLEPQQAELAKTIDDLQTRVTALRGTASDADKKMVAIEARGFQDDDPETVKSLIAEYEALSKKQREAAREAELLEFGGYTNATLISDDGEPRTARVEPATPGEALKATTSLKEYQQRKATLDATAAAEKESIDVFRGKIAVLQQRQAELTQQIEGRLAAGDQPAVPGLRAQRDALTKQIAAVTASIVETAKELHDTETAAIQEVDTGLAAAERIAQAVQRRQREAREARSSSSDGPNERIDMISRESWRIGDAGALVGDLELLKAWIDRQIAMNQTRLAHAYERAQQAGAPVDPAAAYREAYAAEFAAQDAAAQAAKQYEDAAQGELQDDWNVHMNMASAYYLQSLLAEGNEARTLRDKALATYREATTGREKDPYRRPFGERAVAIERMAADAGGADTAQP